MKKLYNLSDVTFAGNSLLLEVDGKSHRFDLSEVSKPLPKASEKERSTYEIAPSGYGIYWSLIGEDLSIDGLLGVRHFPKSQTINA